MYKMRSASIHHNLFDNNHFIKLFINSIEPTIKFTTVCRTKLRTLNF